MYLKKDLSRDGSEYYLRIMKTFTINGEKYVRTVYKIGSFNVKNVQALETWQKVVDIINETEEKSRLIEQEIKEAATKKDSTDDGDRVSLNLGTCFIKQVLAFFDYRGVFARTQRKHKFKYQLYQVYFYLVYNSILDPSSILKSVDLQKRLYENYDLELDQIYRALNYIDDLDENIQRRESQVIMDNFADTTGIFYLDTTNFYCYGPEDESEEGLRKFGYSKDGKKLPLVGVSLLMTHNGFPLCKRTYAGNESDSTQLIPLIKKFEIFGPDSRSLIGGDAAFNAATNTFYLAGSNLPGSLNNGFVFSRSVLKCGQETLDWLYSKTGWRYKVDKNWTLEELEERKKACKEAGSKGQLYKIDYKKQTEVRTIKVWNHDHTKKIPVEQHVTIIGCFSDKLRARKLHTLQKQYDKAYKALEDPKLLERAINSSTNEYLKLENSQEVGQKDQDGKKPKFVLNLEKIDRDFETAGFYLLETSESQLNPVTVMHLFSDKYLIEWLFRVLKSDLKIRPVYVRKPEHIKPIVHIRITALMTLRVLQFCLGGEYSIHEIHSSLRNFSCVKDGEEYLVFGRDDVIRKLESFFGIEFKDRMTKRELDHLFSYQAARERCCQVFCSFCRDWKNLNLKEIDWEELKKHSNIVRTDEN